MNPNQRYLLFGYNVIRWTRWKTFEPYVVHVNKYVIPAPSGAKQIYFFLCVINTVSVRRGQVDGSLHNRFASEKTAVQFQGGVFRMFGQSIISRRGVWRCARGVTINGEQIPLKSSITMINGEQIILSHSSTIIVRTLALEYQNNNPNIRMLCGRPLCGVMYPRSRR